MGSCKPSGAKLSAKRNLGNHRISGDTTSEMLKLTALIPSEKHPSPRNHVWNVGILEAPRGSLQYSAHTFKHNATTYPLTAPPTRPPSTTTAGSAQVTPLPQTVSALSPPKSILQPEPVTNRTPDGGGVCGGLLRGHAHAPCGCHGRYVAHG